MKKPNACPTWLQLDVLWDAASKIAKYELETGEHAHPGNIYKVALVCGQQVVTVRKLVNKIKKASKGVGL